MTQNIFMLITLDDDIKHVDVPKNYSVQEVKILNAKNRNSQFFCTWVTKTGCI